MQKRIVGSWMWYYFHRETLSVGKAIGSFSHKIRFHCQIQPHEKCADYCGNGWKKKILVYLSGRVSSVQASTARI